MGRNVFVSYKYADDSVKQFNNGRVTISRDYVNIIEKILGKTGNYYYRGEKDGEDLSHLDYKTVEGILADKIYYTSITIVLISPRMFENVSEIEQWIPWEISYSLRNKTRYDGNSYMNAILAVVLPNRKGRYGYALRTYNGGLYVRERAFFEIILRNMFNRKCVKYYTDEQGNPEYNPGDSYVAIAKWNDFCRNPEFYLKQALCNRGEWESFMITKKIDESWIS